MRLLIERGLRRIKKRIAMIRVNALSESRGSGIPPGMVMPALRLCRIDRPHSPRGNAILDAPESTHQRPRNGNHLARQSVATRSVGMIKLETGQPCGLHSPRGRACYGIAEFLLF